MKDMLLIAGPCAAENEEQLWNTALQLADQLNKNDYRLSYFRAGIWKPRSNPNEFTGAGIEALPWLSEIQKKFGFKVCVEVAKPEHLDYCEQYDIKTVWVGSRTTVNPFIVEELAENSKGRGFSVMVKNPMIPDLKLWRGSIERFRKAGVENIMAVHRGVPEQNENILRNTPLWEMPVELKVQLPEIPLICDVSHIAGDKNYLGQISQIALDFGFNGLMIETHYRPEIALSDARQQITPSELTTLLQNLKVRDGIDSTDLLLLKQRNMIEHIDNQISLLLKKRMNIVDHIAQIKSDHNMPIVDPVQFNKVIERYNRNTDDDDDYREFITKYLELLHQSSIQRQRRHE